MPPSSDDPTAISPASRAPSQLATGCVITVIEGPDAGARFAVDGQSGPRVLIGQSPSCEVRLRDQRVSRRHAALDLGQDGIRLVDLGSTNGTYVSGLRAFDVQLAGGELLAIGDTLLRVDSLQKAAVPTSEADRFGKTRGASLAMRRIYPACERLASAPVPVLIEGETGTGKEVLAESLHDASPRRDGPFVVFDCTTIVPGLVEATLFGHERGAFTGAVASHTGIFEEADGGTLFLDEIGDLDVALQAKLLRAIERSEVRRVGGTKLTKVDVRILSATRRDLDREVQAGRFRDDLFFRLAVSRIELPPLRKRTGDVSLLAQTFWRALGGAKDALSGDFLRKLEDYDWPGNVRQLRNVVTQHFALGEMPALDAPSVRHGPGSADDHEPGGAPELDALDTIVARDLPFFAARDAVMLAFEQRYVARVLAQHGGHVGNAAEASGMGRRYFQRIRNRTKGEDQ